MVVVKGALVVHGGWPCECDLWQSWNVVTPQVPSRMRMVANRLSASASCWAFGV